MLDANQCKSKIVGPLREIEFGAQRLALPLGLDFRGLSSCFFISSFLDAQNMAGEPLSSGGRVMEIANRFVFIVASHPLIV